MFLWVYPSFIYGCFMSTAALDYALDYRDPDPTADHDLSSFYNGEDEIRWDAYVSRFVRLFPSNENGSEPKADYDILVTEGIEQDQGWRVAGHGEYPFSVVLFSPKNDLLCGASIITTVHILTACSCVMNLCQLNFLKENPSHGSQQRLKNDVGNGYEIHFTPQTNSYYKPERTHNVRFVANYQNCLKSLEEEHKNMGITGLSTAIGVFTPPLHNTEYGHGVPWPPQPFTYLSMKTENDVKLHYNDEDVPLQIQMGAVVGFGFHTPSNSLVTYYNSHINPSTTMIFITMLLHHQRHCIPLLPSARMMKDGMLCMCVSKLPKKAILLGGHVGTPVVSQGKLVGFMGIRLMKSGNQYCTLVAAMDEYEIKHFKMFIKDLEIEKSQFYKHRTSFHDYDVFVPKYMWKRKVDSRSAAVNYVISDHSFFLRMLIIISLTILLT